VRRSVRWARNSFLQYLQNALCLLSGTGASQPSKIIKNIKILRWKQLYISKSEVDSHKYQIQNIIQNLGGTLYLQFGDQPIVSLLLANGFDMQTLFTMRSLQFCLQIIINNAISLQHCEKMNKLYQFLLQLVTPNKTQIH
jgi:hypothetical protein